MTLLSPVLPAPFVPPAPEPPEQSPPFLGQLRGYRRNVIGTWPRRAYEEMVFERPFFGRRTLLLNAPEAIRHVLVEATERYGRTPATLRVLRPLLGEGLVLAEGAAWRHQRRTLAPAFAPRAIATLLPLMRAAVDDSVAALPVDRPLDLLGAMQMLALEVAGRTMISLGMGRWRAEMRGRLERYGQSGGLHLFDLMLPPAIPTPWDLRRRWHGARWMALIERIVAARQAERRQGEATDLLDMLLAARDPETGRAFPPREVRDQVATLLLAGHETTSLAIFWSLVLLAQAPAWQDRVAAEAGAAQQPLTRAVVEEAMRLYPPAFTLARLAREPDEVAGVTLRRGDAVLIAPWVLHRHRRLWERPEEFDPRRFLPPAPPPERFAYLPFGAGPRVCIGAPFALAEATLALSAILGRFRLALPGKRPVMPLAVTTTVPDHRPLFRLERR
ncbi:cytochrome P450 [Paracraurococcus lichenis]|uniref:Cytochrome P450 n=1 Tax=Paracraurococcus lichenis TaxID=3064888 RepID=A0ABT9DT23_9PROT|nr:cytochrome P450 [Paracraurococcus sp. LOR1-02]MDO9707042.1 cytochrome P450 [Paracraurococcus sp. LOR1-02]